MNYSFKYHVVSLFISWKMLDCNYKDCGKRDYLLLNHRNWWIKLGNTSNWRNRLRLNKRTMSVCIVRGIKRMHSASVKYLRHFNSQVATQRGNPSIFRAGDPLTLWKHVAASKNVTLREYVPLFFFFFPSLTLSLSVSLSFSFFSFHCKCSRAFSRFHGPYNSTPICIWTRWNRIKESNRTSIIAIYCDVTRASRCSGMLK